MDDKMILKGMRFRAHHGYLLEEKSLGQWFQVDLEVHLDLNKASHTDALEDTLNYVALFEMVKSVMEGPSKNLLEALAGQILERCFAFTRIEKVVVRIEKPQVPIQGSLAYAAVELTRSRKQWMAQNSLEEKE